MEEKSCKRNLISHFAVVLKFCRWQKVNMYSRSSFWQALLSSIPASLISCLQIQKRYLMANTILPFQYVISEISCIIQLKEAIITIQCWSSTYLQYSEERRSYIEQITPTPICRTVAIIFSNILYKMKHDNDYSQIKEIRPRLPQGSVVGPPLQLVYITDSTRKYTITT